MNEIIKDTVIVSGSGFSKAKNKLYPVYSEWKKQINKNFKNYVVENQLNLKSKSNKTEE